MQKKPSGLLKFRYSKWQKSEDDTSSCYFLIKPYTARTRHNTAPPAGWRRPCTQRNSWRGEPFTAFTCPAQLPLQPETYWGGDYEHLEDSKSRYGIGPPPPPSLCRKCSRLRSLQVEMKTLNLTGAGCFAPPNRRTFARRASHATYLLQNREKIWGFGCKNDSTSAAKYNNITKIQCVPAWSPTPWERSVYSAN